MKPRLRIYHLRLYVITSVLPDSGRQNMYVLRGIFFQYTTKLVKVIRGMNIEYICFYYVRIISDKRKSLKDFPLWPNATRYYNYSFFLSYGPNANGTSWSSEFIK